MRQGEYSRCWARIALMVCLLSANSPVAYSSEPPAYPGPTEPTEGQCLEASIQQGPDGCTGVLIPTSWGADYLMWEDYGIGLQAIFMEETDSLLGSLQALLPTPSGLKSRTPPLVLGTSLLSAIFRKPT